MKRQLTTEEEKLEKLGIERNKSELIRLRKQMEYNKDLLKLQDSKFAHEDKWRNYLRKLNDEENEKSIKLMESDIKIKEQAIKISEEHIKSGVEVKSIKAVEG